MDLLQFEFAYIKRQARFSWVRRAPDEHTVACIYESWNKPEEAESWRAKLPETEAVEE
jgi:hypothetical protein